jgi:hypothetical protein
MTTRQPRPALYAALGVLAFLVMRDLIQVAFYFSGFEYLGQQLATSLSRDVAFAAGVFVVLWGVLPVTAASTTAKTIVSGAAAGLAGGIVTMLADVLIAFVIDVPYPRPVGVGIMTVLLTALTLLPLTVLAAILLREWLRSKVATSPTEPSAQEPAEAV